MPTKLVTTERRGRTWLVAINRPVVRNCVNGETAQGLEDAVTEFRGDDTLDVMVLTGAGTEAFCSGADLKAIGTLTDRPGAGVSGPMGISRIIDVGKPVIGAINGYCTAGGLELACWCDLRIASKDAQFGVLNRRWGVPLVDGGTQRLPQIVGLGNALYMIETGVLLTAKQAKRIGLVQEVVKDGKAVARALEIAETMSTYPQSAIRNDRRAALRAFELPIADGLRFEVEAHSETLNDPAMADWLVRFAAGERPEPIRSPE